MIISHYPFPCDLRYHSIVSLSAIDNPLFRSQPSILPFFSFPHFSPIFLFPFHSAPSLSPLPSFRPRPHILRAGRAPSSSLPERRDRGEVGGGGHVIFGQAEDQAPLMTRDFLSFIFLFCLLFVLLFVCSISRNNSSMTDSTSE